MRSPCQYYSETDLQSTVEATEVLVDVDIGTAAAEVDTMGAGVLEEARLKELCRRQYMNHLMSG